MHSQQERSQDGFTRSISCLTNHPEYFTYIKKLVDKTRAVANNSPSLARWFFFFFFQDVSDTEQGRCISVGTFGCTWNRMQGPRLSARPRGSHKEPRCGEAATMGSARRGISLIFLYLLQSGSVLFCSLKDEPALPCMNEFKRHKQGSLMA